MVDVSNNWSERQVMGVDRGFGQQLTADEPRPYPETRPSRAARQLKMGLKRPLMRCCCCICIPKVSSLLAKNKRERQKEPLSPTINYAICRV